MKKTISRLFLLILFLLCAIPTLAQTSAVTATITDSDSTAWANGSVSVSFVPIPGYGGQYQYQGSTFVPQTYAATMNSGGLFTVTVPDNSFISPAGTQWLFIICSYTSAPCSQTTTPIIGPTLNLSAQFSAAVKAPRFPANGPGVAGAYGYTDTEISTIPVPGGTYFNVTSALVRLWTGATWVNGGGGGGGSGGVNPGTYQAIAAYPLPGVNSLVGPTNCSITGIGLNNLVCTGSGTFGNSTLAAQLIGTLQPDSACLPSGPGLAELFLAGSVSQAPLFSANGSPCAPLALQGLPNSFQQMNSPLLIANGNFELPNFATTGPIPPLGWGNLGTDTGTQSYDTVNPAPNKTFSLKMHCNANSAECAMPNLSFASVIPGEVYTVTAYARSDGTAPAALCLEFEQGGGSVINDTSNCAFTLSTSWTFLTVTGTAQTGQDYLIFDLADTSNPTNIDGPVAGDMWFDDVQAYNNTLVGGLNGFVLMGPGNTELSNAVAGCPAAPAGCTVIIPPGASYTLSGPIVAVQPLHIIGAGASFQNAGTHCVTMVTRTDASTAIPFVFSGTAATGGSLENFCFNNTGRSPAVFVDNDAAAGDLNLRSFVIDFPTVAASVAGVRVGSTAETDDFYANHIFIRAAAPIQLQVLDAQGQVTVEGESVFASQQGFGPSATTCVQIGGLGGGGGQLTLDATFIHDSISCDQDNIPQVTILQGLKVTFVSPYFEQQNTASYAIDCPSTAIECQGITVIAPEFGAVDATGMSHTSTYAIHSGLAISQFAVYNPDMFGLFANPNYLFKNDATAKFELFAADIQTTGGNVATSYTNVDYCGVTIAGVLQGCQYASAVVASSVKATGTVDGQAPLTIVTAASFSLGNGLSSGYYVNESATAGAASAGTLPTAAAGIQKCFGNGYNGSAPNTGILSFLTSAAGQFIIFTDGTLSASGGFVQSGGAAADFACVIGVDSTHWLFKPSSGVWSKH